MGHVCISKGSQNCKIFCKLSFNLTIDLLMVIYHFFLSCPDTTVPTEPMEPDVTTTTTATTNPTTPDVTTTEPATSGQTGVSSLK